MLSLIQVVTKNDLMKPGEAIYLEKLFNEYGVDIRTINYADLKPLFADPIGFIIKKFELEKKVPKEKLDELKPKAAPKPKAVPTSPKPKPKPITKVEEGIKGASGYKPKK